MAGPRRQRPIDEPLPAVEYLQKKEETRQRAGIISHSRPLPPKDLVAFATIELGGPPDPWQLEYLEAVMREWRVAVVASRQSGKSTIVAIAVAFLILHNAEFKVVVLSRTLNQAGFFMRKVRRAILRYKPRQDIEVFNTLSVLMTNGAMCVCVPCRDPDAARGYDPNMLVGDEASFVPEPTWDAVTPMLAATQGAMHLISSPNGRQGLFYRAVEGDVAQFFWTRKVMAPECPRITQDYLDQQLIIMGPTKFKQEFFCAFLEPEGSFFPAVTIDVFDAAESIDDKSFEDVAYADIQPDLDELRAAFDARRFRVDHGADRFYVPNPRKHRPVDDDPWPG
jgi:hypothetical protein